MVQAFDPGELAQLGAPLSVIAGEADEVASPATDSKVIAAAGGKAHLQVLPTVGHYDFLAECTGLARQRVGKLCEVEAEKSATHAAAIRQAKVLFDSALR